MVNLGQNLYLFISSGVTTDTIEVLMAEKNGRWIGKGIGNLIKLHYLYLDLDNNKIGTDGATSIGLGFNNLIGLKSLELKLEAKILNNYR